MNEQITLAIVKILEEPNSGPQETRPFFLERRAYTLGGAVSQLPARCEPTSNASFCTPRPGWQAFYPGPTRPWTGSARQDLSVLVSRCGPHT